MGLGHYCLLFLIPLLTVVLGAMVFGEVLGTWQAFGGGLIVLGLFIVR